MRKEHKDREVLERLLDEGFYERAAIEINEGKRREGLWLKAMTMTSGDESKARLKYVELLVKAFRDEGQAEADQAQAESSESPSVSSPPLSNAKPGLIKRAVLWLLFVVAAFGALGVMSRLVVGYVAVIDLVAVLFWALVIQFTLKRLFPK